VQTACGVFSTGTGALGTTIPITGLGFQPKIVFFWWDRRTETSDALSDLTCMRGFGAAVSSTSRWAVVTRSGTGQANAVTDCMHTTVACLLSIAPSVDGALDFQSMDADGFTLVVDDVMPRDDRVIYLAIGGNEIVAELGVFTPTGTAPVTQQVSLSMSETPRAVIFGAIAGAVAAPPPTAGGVDSHLMIGAMAADGSQAVWTGASNDGSPTMVTGSYCHDAECIARFGSTVSGIADRAQFSAVGPGSFTVNWLERAGAGGVLYAALAGCAAKVLGALTQTDTTTPIAVSGLGATPKAVMVISAGETEDAADSMHNEDRWSFGVATSPSSRAAYCGHDDHSPTTSDVVVGLYHAAVYANVDAAGASGTLNGLMDVQSFDGDGVTFIMDDADPAQKFFWTLILGDAPIAARIVHQQAVHRASYW
jgi:hypothetical protein